MTAPAKCPACGAKLQPEMLDCPNCPMSFGEPVETESVFKSSFVRDFLVPVAFLAGLGWGVYAVGQKLFALAAEQGAPDAPGAEPAAPAPPPPPAAAPAEPAVSVQVLPTPAPAADGGEPRADVVDARRRLKERRAEEAQARRAAREAEAEDEELSAVSITGEPQPPPREWRLRGVVYDLASLRPLPGVTLTFRDDREGTKAKVVTDPLGRYRAALRPLPGRGYVVTIERDGKPVSYVEGDPDPREMEEGRRVQLSREMSRTIGKPERLEPYGAMPLKTDFYLAPSVAAGP